MMRVTTLLAIICVALLWWAPLYAEGLININTATLKELDEGLPGVGPAIAQRIIDGRPYASTEEISEVEGIGDPGTKTYEDIINLITVGEVQTQTPDEEDTQTDTQTEPVSDTSSSSSSSSSSSQSSGSTFTSISARIVGKAVVVAGAHAIFEGQALNGKTQLESARFNWNFGDGVVESRKRVTHIYSYPGKYVVALEVSSNGMEATERLTVEVVSLELSLTVQQDGALSITNKSKREVDIGNWGLSGRGITFTIPKGTIALSGTTLHFAQGITGVRGDLQALLLYPSGAVATTAQSSITPSKSVTGGSSKTPPAKTVDTSNSSFVRSETEVSPSIFTAQAATVATAELDGLSLPLWSYMLGLVALIILGVAGTLYARMPESYKEATSSADGFEILDEKE